LRRAGIGTQRAQPRQEQPMTDFQNDVIAASHRQPVLVDFHAHWCNPCRMLGPVLDQAVRQADGPLKLVKIDTDQDGALAAEAGVSGIPDVRLYYRGEQIGAFTGFRPLPQVLSFIRDRLRLGQTTPA
jgi:putative thioredoxin